MKDFSPSYLDKLANRLEEMSGDPRVLGEDVDSRILTSLENMAGITTPNGDYQQRVCDAVNNINVGGGGGANLGTANFNENGVYNATEFDLDGFNQVNIQVPSSGASTISPFYDPLYGRIGQTLQICFNAPVELSNEFNSGYGMFAYFKAFNQPVSIPNSVTECISMFEYCCSFNQPITIPNSVTDCDAMFSYCITLNQPVVISNSVTRCKGMFDGCNKFNQPITIPNTVTNCQLMFRDCHEFNQPITVPESVTNISNMFTGCSNMNSLVRLPEEFNNGTTTAFWTGCPVSVANGTLEFY